MLAGFSSRQLRRQQLDRQIEAATLLSSFMSPRGGWIREVRLVLGMSARQLAERMGVRQPTVAKLERTEQKGAITLASLNRAAESLGCRLVYALVPETSYSKILEERAEAVARRLVAKVQQTMALEDQATRQER